MEQELARAEKFKETCEATKQNLVDILTFSPLETMAEHGCGVV